MEGHLLANATHNARVTAVSMAHGTALVRLLREAGAEEVHMRITCPPITHACHFGVDMGHDGDLMAARLTVEEMREHIGADSLAFLSIDGMMQAVASRPAADDDGSLVFVARQVTDDDAAVETLRIATELAEHVRTAARR